MSNERLLWIENYLMEKYKMPSLENFLQLEIVKIDEGKVNYRAKIIDKHCNLYGVVHGGVLASIIDTVMGIACISLGKRVVTTDMSVSYIKNVAEGSTITAVGKVISNGKTIMRTVGQVFDEQQQILINSQGSYFVIGDFCEEDYPKK